MNEIVNGLELSKQSWAALRQNRQLIAFPIISMIGLIIITALLFIPAAALLKPLLAPTGQSAQSASESDPSWLLLLVILFVYYLIAYFLVIFSNTALVGATMKLIKDGQATVGDGISVAMSRLGKIIVYALISATIGIIARRISQSGRNSDNIIVSILAAIVGALVQGAWNLLIFFALPVMVVENLSVISSLKRSLEIFKQTWGENFVGQTAIGGISCLISLVILVVTGGMIAAGIALDSLPLLILGGVLMVLGFMVVGLLNGAVNGIFQASLYQFAMTGDAGPLIETELARKAFG
jgi:small-conductance mechanosensitive channel